MDFTIIYCYDAYCGWCFGFSPVIKKVEAEFKDKYNFEVLSGGMILPEKPVPISATASYIQQAYKNVEELTGVRFGNDYLWHINNPGKSDWYPHSEKPAIALCVFKDYYPGEQISFAADMQYALHVEGRDLVDDEAYRHLLDRYNIEALDFYSKLHSPQYKQRAYDDFALVKQLKVNGYPSVLLQVTPTMFYQLAIGYTPFEKVKYNLEKVISGLDSSISAGFGSEVKNKESN